MLHPSLLDHDRPGSDPGDGADGVRVASADWPALRRRHRGHIGAPGARSRGGGGRVVVRRPVGLWRHRDRGPLRLS